MASAEIPEGRQLRESPQAAAHGAVSLRLARIAVQKGDGFTLAYATNLSHRVPLLYCVLLFVMLILMASFHGTASGALTLWLPLPFLVGICWRAVHWLPANVRKRSLAEMALDIRRLPFVGTAAALIPICWSLMLYRNGSEAQQSLIHYTTAVTCFTFILTLGQSPRTAISMAAFAMIPSNIFFFMHDHANMAPIVAVQTVVTILLILITASYHQDFVSLEHSRQQHAHSEKQYQELAETNRLSAIRDELTGANNRRNILAVFQKMLAHSPLPGPWLVLVDVDGFKHINDTYGHAAGDAVLCAVTNRIAAVPEIDSFGRMGGDEFALLISGDLPLAEVKESLERLDAALRQPIEMRDYRLSVWASIGVYRCNSYRVSENLERADAALYKAKEGRGGGIAMFTFADERLLGQRRAMMRTFTSTDLGRQLKLVYQPIVDSDTGRPVAYEALARWSPDGTSLLSPASFINLAESTGRIGELTEIVLARAFDECRAWQWDCKLAVNLSARDILREDGAKRIERIATAAGAPPSSIILEITETALLSDYHRAAENLTRLRDMGFLIALDDFGTGQSSLSHVHNLPFDRLKIDQSFARDIVHSERARAIVGTILALARQLRMECVIEGIESSEQGAVARALGVRHMQGYHFGYPVQAAEAFGERSSTPLVSNAARIR